MPQITNNVRIEREIRNSVQRFNERCYLYEGERMWTRDSGIITVRIYKRGSMLVASIQFGHRIPRVLAENLRVKIGTDSEQFSAKGQASFPKQAGTVFVQLEVIG